jgi:putative cell wall-binding protein
LTIRATSVDSVDVLYAATGTTFPDGLAAAPLAATTGAPVLLVEPCRVPAPVADTASRLSVSRVVLLGGHAAVCDDVARGLAA